MSDTARTKVLAADFGSTGAKAFVLDARGTLLAEAYAEYPTQRSRPHWATQDPDDWWRALCEIFPAVLRRADVAPDSIAGIGISSHYPTMLPLDGCGRPVAPAQTWMDERGAPACESVDRTLTDAGLVVNPTPVEGFSPIPKLLWLREHEPASYGATRHVVQVGSYLVSRLTGTYTIDRTNASWFHTYDVAGDSWSQEAAAALGLPLHLFPTMREPDEIAGRVHEDAARAAGLRAGTPVVVGTGDATAAALGAGLTEPGDGYLSMGTGGCVMFLTDSPIYGEGLVTEAYVQSGQWLVEGVVKNIAILLQWFLRELGAAEQRSAESLGVSPYAVMDDEVESTEAAADGLVVLPYLGGEQSPINDPNSRGVVFGLTVDTTRPQIIRALMESVAFAVRHNLDAMAAAGASMRQLRVAGGPAKSDTWLQIIADVTGKPILRTAMSDTAPLGTAMLVTAALGCAPGLPSAPIDSELRPRPHLRDRYDSSYRVYRELYDRLQPLFARHGSARAQEVAP